MSAWKWKEESNDLKNITQVTYIHIQLYYSNIRRNANIETQKKKEKDNSC